MQLRTRVATMLGFVGLLGGMLLPTTAAAQSSGTTAPNPAPQVVPSGYESLDQLQQDAVQNAASGTQYSAWLLESSRFIGVPFGSFMPDRAKEPPIDFPVNYGAIKGKDGKITLYDSGWQQQAYIYRWNAGCCNAPARDQLLAIGLNPDDVSAIVIGHGHWDHAGQLDEFPNATLYVQKEELKAIDWALNYPDPRISAWNTMSVPANAPAEGIANTCARTPACGYTPQTMMQIAGKLMAGKAQIVDGRTQIAPGMIIHPAFRGHTYGAQLLQVNTPTGQLVFGSDTYSSWEGIRNWNIANLQQTDTVQQFLAYEKCYVLTGTPTNQQPNNCIAAHERLSYSRDYPITQYWWNITDASGNKLNCSRAAELTLANAEKSHMPANPDQKMCAAKPDLSKIGAYAETTNPGVPIPNH